MVWYGMRCCNTIWYTLVRPINNVSTCRPEKADRHGSQINGRGPKGFSSLRLRRGGFVGVSFDRSSADFHLPRILSLSFCFLWQLSVADERSCSFQSSSFQQLSSIKLLARALSCSTFAVALSIHRLAAHLSLYHSKSYGDMSHGAAWCGVSPYQTVPYRTVLSCITSPRITTHVYLSHVARVDAFAAIICHLDRPSCHTSSRYHSPSNGHALSTVCRKTDSIAPPPPRGGGV